MVEIQDAKKCCFCLPLRRGLLAWVYTKLIITTLVLNGVILLYFILSCFDILGILLPLLIFIQVVLGLEIIFDILFIISAHKKKHVYLRIYYRYQIVSLVNYIIIFATYTALVIIDFHHTNDILVIFLPIGAVILVLIVLHIYFIYLVRSEVRKLELTTQFNFKNLGNEPECTAQIFDQ